MASSGLQTNLLVIWGASMGHQILHGLFVAAVLSAESGLLALNRVILATGVNKFPYPVTLSLIQCLITSFFVVAADRLLHNVASYIKPREFSILSEIDQEASYLKNDDRRSSHEDVLRPSSPELIGAPDSTADNPKTFADAVWKAAPTAFVYCMKVVLGNVFLAHLPLPTYVLLRLGAIPLSFLLNALFKTDSHSVLAVGSLTVATSSLVVTILHFTEQVTLGHLFLGLPVSVADALFPFLLWRASHDQSHKVPSQGSSPRDHVNVANASPLPHRIRTFWSTLRLIPLLSTAVLIPVFFLSGELQDIRRNCYILDITTLWHLLVASGIVNGVNLILLWLLATATSPVTMTFLAAPIYAFQLAVFTHSRSTLYSWADIGICWSFSMGFLALHMREGGLTAATRTIYSSLRNLHIAAVVLASVYLLLRVNRELFSSDDVEVSTIASCEMGFHPNSAMNLSEPTEVTNSVNDNYLGIRPDVDTVANLTLLVDRCSEVVDGTGVDDVVRCLSYLANTDEEYFSLPDAGPNYRASEQDFGKSEDIDGVSHVNALTKYLHLSGPKAASTKSIGKCDGPVYPYHVYWTGSASWRVELFIKAYLYTQNLPCSRLWLWLDSDLDPNAVDKMLCHDPIFSKFRPLVERGDIVLKRWNFPHRVPLVTESVESTGLSAIQSRTANTSNEKILADGTIQDVNGQQWLALHPTHTAFLPVQVSDAVRFIVLHQYGGVYLDMDVLMLRDMRPLLLPDPNTGNPSAFAEQWVERCNPGEYNTAIISLPANSSLSSYLLRGGVRMGMNFHPKMIGRMMWSDGRNDELKMLHNAVFDPLVTNLRREGTNTCTVPCHKNFKSAFMGTVEEAANEWSNYRGNKSLEVTDNAAQGNLGDALLPTNRTMENFFRGAWAYHIHNQWWKFPEPSSWMDVITRAQDGFFEGSRTNVYGEMWAGPAIDAYNRTQWVRT